MERRIRVLIVDDSALAREMLSQGLALDPDIEVVGTAGDPYQARDKIISLKPEVVTLDIEMPRMDGLEFLRRLMAQYPLPVVMVSGLTEAGKEKTLEALAAGAVDFVPKPRADVARRLDAMMDELRAKIKAASKADVSHWKRKQAARPSPAVTQLQVSPGTKDRLIAIGASTGGVEALRKLLTQFPASMPPVLVVQHLPAGFTGLFAQRMNSLSEMCVQEAEDGQLLRPGLALIAPGGRHMRLARQLGNYCVRVEAGEPVNGACPSVDVFLQSVAEVAGANAIGIMLTGMGRDGADAMKAMRTAGARCLAQDEASSVVFGMPKEAYKCGGAERLTPLDEIAATIIGWLEGKA